jgi:membrane protein DedA with SNARE-associated domain
VGFVVHALQHIPPLSVYLLVALFLLLESSGIPLLNTTLLLCTGALAALGNLNLGLLTCAAIVGSVLGACSAYGLGQRYGDPLLLRLARLLRIDARKVRMAEGWFASSGARMIFFSRMLPYIRPFACFPAGISAMPFHRFLLAALAGSTIWCTTFLIVGWELGPRWKLASHLVRTYTLPTCGIILALLVISFFCKRSLTRYVRKRLAKSAESERDSDLLEV